MSESVRIMFEKLPTYWKLATIRCSIYCLVAGCNGIISGLDGYQGWAEISGFTLFKIAVSVSVDMLMTWVAFLDSSLKDVKQPGGTLTTVSETVTLPVKTPVQDIG